MDDTNVLTQEQFKIRSRILEETEMKPFPREALKQILESHIELVIDLNRALAGSTCEACNRVILDNDALTVQNKRMKEALEWYALSNIKDIFEDSGDRERAILEALKEVNP